MADDEEEAVVYNRGEAAIACVYAVAIGVNVYLIADQLSDGALSRALSLQFYRIRGEVRDRIRFRRSLKKDVSHMLWEAVQIVEGE